MSNVGNIEEAAMRGLQEFMDLALALWMRDAKTVKTKLLSELKQIPESSQSRFRK